MDCFAIYFAAWKLFAFYAATHALIEITDDSTVQAVHSQTFGLLRRGLRPME